MTDDNQILSTALTALAAGLTPIRAKTDGSKAPLGQWKQWQSEPPDELTVMGWFRDWPNLGLVTGAVSGRLVCVEFEGRFMGRWPDVRQALEAADLWSVFEGWGKGYSEWTPSEGLHILIRLGGDQPLDGNRKIALDAHGETTIETRSEGGFVIIAPSNGDTHPSGGAWKIARGGLDTIELVDPPEYEAVLAVLASFDERPQAPAPQAPLRLDAMLADDRPSWIDQSSSSWPAMSSVLEAHGWQYHHADNDHHYWTRPGKDRRLGHSASVNRRDRLHVFSSAAHPLLATDRQTYDVIDVLGAYDLGHLPDTAERVAVIRRFGGPTPVVLGRTVEVPTEGTSIPAEFFEARAALDHIRQAARSRMVSPDAVFHATLARVAACTPHLVHLPPLIGGSVPLSYLTMLVGPPEAGKSGAFATAQALIPAPASVADGLPIGTGEGLIDVLFGMVTEPDPDTGKPHKVKKQVRHAANIYVDEGMAMAAIGGRSGATLMPTLRTIFTGGVLGSTNADLEKRRIVPAGQAVYGVVVAVQPEMAGTLLSRNELLAGTPQRFTYANALDPGAGYGTDWPGLLGWTPPTPMDLHDYMAASPGGGYQRAYVEIEGSIIARIKAYRLDSQHGVARETIDAHKMLVIEKIGAGLMLLDGRLTLTEEDWELAELVFATSTAVRSTVVRRIQEEATTSEEAYDSRLARRQVRIEEGTERAQLARTKVAVLRIIRREPQSRRNEIRRDLSGKAQRDCLDAAIDELASEGAIRQVEIAGQGQPGVVYEAVDK